MSLLPSKDFAALAQVLRVNGVLRHHAQLANSSTFPVFNNQIVKYKKRPVIKLDMVVGTKAQEVLQNIWAPVTLPQRQNMRAFRVRTKLGLKPNSADLTTKIVEPFDLFRKR